MDNRNEIWFDARDLTNKETKELIPLVTNNGYEGVLVLLKNKEIISMLSQKTKLLLLITEDEINECISFIKENIKSNIYIFSKNEEVLKHFSSVETGLFLDINNKNSLMNAIKLTETYNNFIIDFIADTNIPLELVLTFSQKNNSLVCKKVDDASDGWIASMVMETGSQSVLLSSKSPDNIIGLRKYITSMLKNYINIKPLKVKETVHIGMGHRVCIDTTSILKEDEGIILGSTSSGGILVSSETHFLPYMELRPFRVNAGAIHLYSWNFEDKTDYLSELTVGSQIMVVNSKGESRSVTVGRIKIERRPLLLIKALDDEGIEVNVILQDDWHVRVFGLNGEPINCTELKPETVVLGYTCLPGRHVGYKIDEHILEK